MRKIYGGLVFLILAIIFIVIVLLNHNAKPKISFSLSGQYVALGDSVSAGDGLESYSDSSACNRTNQAYPNIIASKLKMGLNNLSCSGASVSQGINGPQTVNQLALPAQLDQTFKITRPKLISITIGANDVHWTDFIARCYSGQCGTSTDSNEANVLLQNFNSSLNNVLTVIKAHYGTNVPNVVVTGYYQIFPTSGSCSDIKGITSTEINWLRQQQDNLNSAINTVVANYSFAKYAPIDFSGHELCSGDSWLQGLNDKAPYHPNDAGQNEYAKSIITAENKFK